MNSKIVLSLASIFASVAIVGAATYAYFSDQATSTGNTFTSGTFDLKLTDNNQGPTDTVDTTWSSNNMAPGTNPVTATLWFRNSGTVNGDHVHFKAANTPTDTGTAEDLGPMDKLLEITAMTYDAGDILPSISDSNGNGIKDLDDLESAGDGVQIGSLTDLNTDHALVMTVQLYSSANDTYQGDSVSTVFTATLHQNSSQ